jgi:hypothetical protein
MFCTYVQMQEFGLCDLQKLRQLIFKTMRRFLPEVRAKYSERHISTGQNPLIDITLLPFPFPPFHLGGSANGDDGHLGAISPPCVGHRGQRRLFYIWSLGHLVCHSDVPDLLSCDGAALHIHRILQALAMGDGGDIVEAASL